MSTGRGQAIEHMLGVTKHELAVCVHEFERHSIAGRRVDLATPHD